MMNLGREAAGHGKHTGTMSGSRYGGRESPLPWKESATQVVMHASEVLRTQFGSGKGDEHGGSEARAGFIA
jgi:hypothetical protein